MNAAAFVSILVLFVFLIAFVSRIGKMPPQKPMSWDGAIVPWLFFLGTWVLGYLSALPT